MSAGRMDVRSELASKLTCWHRLTEIESDELVALFAAHKAEIAQAEPTNEELERLWETSHVGHPADFAADVLERWGGWPAGTLGYGGSLNKTQPTLIAQEVEPVGQVVWLLGRVGIDWTDECPLVGTFLYTEPKPAAPTAWFADPAPQAVNAELLEALQAMVESVCNIDCGEMDRKLAIKDARAAIAKAVKP